MLLTSSDRLGGYITRVVCDGAFMMWLLAGVAEAG